MARQRQAYLAELKDWLTRLDLSIAADVALRHQDSSIELETFFRDLLNFLFGWHLENANTLFGENQDSFDLSDREVSIAVQVTVTTTSKKIRKTLKGFVGTHDSTYRRLVFVYPRMTISRSRLAPTSSATGFKFDAKRDRIGLGTILRQAQGLTIDRLGQLLDLVRKELGPLGASLNRHQEDEAIRALLAKLPPVGTKHPQNDYALSLARELRDAWATLDLARAADLATQLNALYKDCEHSFAQATAIEVLVSLAEHEQRLVTRIKGRAAPGGDTRFRQLMDMLRERRRAQ